MKRLNVFLAVTFGLTWGLHIPAGLALGTFANGENSSPAMMGLIAVSMFFPLVGALVANQVSQPSERIDLCLRPKLAQNVRYYVVAWFTPAIVSLLGFVVFFALNPQLFDPSMRSFLETMEAAGVPADQLAEQIPSTPLALCVPLLFSLTVAPAINAIPSIGEEAGWRGMLFPTLAERMSERNAALVSGAIWGLWHAPVIAMGHNYGMAYPGFPLVGILTMVLACTAFACWLSLLRLRTDSVWPCAIAHGAFNAIANFGQVFCACGQTPFGPSPLGLVAGIPLIALGLVSYLRLSPTH